MEVVPVQVAAAELELELYGACFLSCANGFVEAMIACLLEIH